MEANRVTLKTAAKVGNIAVGKDITLNINFENNMVNVNFTREVTLIDGSKFSTNPETIFVNLSPNQPIPVDETVQGIAKKQRAETLISNVFELLNNYILTEEQTKEGVIA